MNVFIRTPEQLEQLLKEISERSGLDVRLIGVASAYCEVCGAELVVAPIEEELVHFAAYCKECYQPNGSIEIFFMREEGVIKN